MSRKKKQKIDCLIADHPTVCKRSWCKRGKNIFTGDRVLWANGGYVHYECYYRPVRTQKKTTTPVKRTRQAPLPAADYAKYMKSIGWARRRADYFQTHARICKVCGSDQKIHLHHMTYERMGCELDRDMVALCETHHALVHEHHKFYGGTLQQATLRYIKNMHMQT